ncbi:MAG: D-glycerate dehydrogenase [Hyphomicrobiaceae bacterium]
MSQKKRLFVTRHLPPDVEARAARDYDATLNPEDRLFTTDEIVAAAQDHDALLVCVTDKLPREAIMALPERLGVIATFSVGTDHIDLKAARERGIRVGSAPHGVTIATAEIAMLLILGAARRAPEGEQMMRSRSWQGWGPLQLLGRRLDGKRLGIVGLGKIGQALAQRARGFDMEIHYHNRRRLPPDQEKGAIYHATLEGLLAVSDVLSLNAPATAETRHVLNARTLGLLPKGAIVVNTARGDLVNDDDLVAALSSGQVGYAGLDVYQGEPRIDPRYYGLPNTFLLPHLGSGAIEARNQMGFEALDNVDAFFAGRELPFPVV